MCLRKGGDCAIVLGELGRIHDSPRLTSQEREDQELLEAMALSLSLTPLESGSRNESKAPPPAPPVGPPQEARPLPPGESPPTMARPVYRLPVLFPPVGHAWNHSPIASPKQRAMPKRVRRRPRIWPANPERFCVLPIERFWLFHSATPSPRYFSEDLASASDSAESSDDASSGVSTAESHYNADRYQGFE